MSMLMKDVVLLFSFSIMSSSDFLMTEVGNNSLLFSGRACVILALFYP